MKCVLTSRTIPDVCMNVTSRRPNSSNTRWKGRQDTALTGRGTRHGTGKPHARAGKPFSVSDDHCPLLCPS